MFNGYGDQVASLYTGMDLRKNSTDDGRGVAQAMAEAAGVRRCALVAARVAGWPGARPGNLGANPIEYTSARATGDWTLRVSRRHAGAARRCAA